MEEGKLPRLRALAERGDFRRLASTNPPQSPVAWTTFATGTGPGRHGIFDFIERDPATYLPDVGTGGVRPPRYWHGVVQSAPAEGWTRRRGVPFWQVAAEHGVHAVVLRVPYAFPPDPVPGGRMLSGLGVPALLGTNSTFFYLAGDLATDGKGDPGGGRLVALSVTGDEGRADVPGPADPRGGGRPALTLPLRLRVDRAGDAVTIDFAGRETRVARGAWSPWLAFRVPVVAPLGLPLVALDGLCRFHVLSIDPLRVYLSPDPEHPRYDAVLAARFGDAVLRVYQRMDGIVGEVLDRVGPEATLLVLSDHGFHSYRTGLNVNTWLRDHGYLVQGPLAPGAEKEDFFPGVDWSRTRAYALGTGQIYVNLRGREGRGVVAPGAEYDALLDAIARGLEAEG